MWIPGFSNPQAPAPSPGGLYFPGAGGVGVLEVDLLPNVDSTDFRMSATDAPDECICIAARAMSMHMLHVMPCSSHAVTEPFESRDFTKQSSFVLCPTPSQPQKQGT